MSFKLDVKKAIEATATLIRLSPHRVIGRKRLLALLYLADREALTRASRPIIGGKLSAMKYGPIHSEIYDLIKGGHSYQAEWSKHFESDAHLVVLRHDPGVSALSRFEIGILNEISQKFMGYDDWDVADATHELPEYKKTYQKDTSKPIPCEELIDALGLSEKKDSILEDAKEKEFLDNLFSTHHQQAVKLAKALRAKRQRGTTSKK